MLLLQLQYFVELAKNCHLSKTAEKIGISAPSLSSTINKLEKEVGYPLFDRKGKSMRLNQNGEIFLSYVKNSLEILDTGVKKVQELNAIQTPIIDVFCTNVHLWEKIIFDYSQSQNKKVNIHRLSSTDNLNLSGGFFLGNLFELDESKIDYKRLFEKEKYYVVMNAQNHLAGSEFLTMEDLSNETIFNYDVATDKAKHDHMIELFESVHIPVHFVEGDYFSQSRLLLSNACISISTNIGMQENFLEDKQHPYKKIPLDTKISPKRIQVIAWKKNMAMTRDKSEFLDYVVDYCRKLYDHDDSNK